jgi:hypothetical protein
MKNDVSSGSIIHNCSSIFASTGEVLLRQMQSVFDELELVMSTRGTRHIEMDQNLAHGCMIAWKMRLTLGLSSTIALGSLHPLEKFS